MVFDLTDEISNYVGIVLSAVLPVVIIYYFKVIERRRNAKEVKVAAELKQHNEKTANDLKLASADIAEDLRAHIDEKINNINKSIADLGTRIDLVNSSQSEISKRVDAISLKQLETHKDQLELISDLQNRADMTNGNIANIRNDLMDIQETIEDNTQQQPRSRERRMKRRRILNDSEYQGNVKHHTTR